MNRFKTGLRPSVHTAHTMRRALALAPFLDALGTPPSASTDYVSAVIKQSQRGWGMYMNGPDPDMPAGVPAEGIGDCVCADTCHQIMLHTANAGSIVIPSNMDCLALYKAVGGYVVGDESTDQGCDESSMCEYLMTTGVAGQKSAGTGMIDPKNIDHIKWAIQIFGACRLAIIVDEAMEEQFAGGQPWTTAAAANDPNASGHDFLAVDFDGSALYGVTWGGGDLWPRGLQPVEWPLVENSAWLLEAHAEVWPDFVRAGGTASSGFDLNGLLAKLQLVELPKAA